MRSAAFVALIMLSSIQAVLPSLAAGTRMAAALPQISERTSQAMETGEAIGHGIAPGGTVAEPRPAAEPIPESGHLSGTASFRTTVTAKDLDLGLKALEWRLYDQSRERLLRALDSLNKTRDGMNLKAIARLSLAEAYLGLENYPRTQLMLGEAKLAIFDAFGAESQEAARYYADLAELSLSMNQIPAASAAATQNLRIIEKRGKVGYELAQAQVLMGRVSSKQSFYDEAKDYLKKALPVLEMAPGKDRLDYANALQALAVVEKKLGDEPESAELMKKCLAIKDDAMSLSKSQEQKGIVKYQWTEGMYGSRQIVDPTYPLKYMVIGGVRVACTVVRSYKHVGVLISLANCSNHPLHLSVGSATLEKLSPGRKFMVYCDPGLIDEVLEEDVILDRTWRRRTLCHIQKSRRIPGYLKNGFLDTDDFFGNNEFGLYGAWDNALRDAPPIVTREQFFYDEKPKHSDQELLGFMRGNGSIRPTYIETGGARTGVIFFLRERWDDALVRIHIGNAELQFPFHLAPGQ